MIDTKQPDFTNTPTSPRRPVFHYIPRTRLTPLVSIITAYYNTGPVFQETVRCVERMSFPHWEWIIVDDGSTNPKSLAQLARLQRKHPGVRVIHQANAGPAAARNRAVAEARGRYLLQLDSDDLIEPTFLEKALWVMETQCQFAACGSYNVTFGSHNLLWAHGFQEYEKNLEENMMTHQVVIRRDAFLAAGGYDESIRRGHEDWDLWLNLAEAGYWGYTIPEYLTWYRTQETSRRLETEGDKRQAKAFHAWLQRKHAGLAERFPQPRWTPSVEQPHARIDENIPVENPLLKPKQSTRVLFVVPWLTIGGADKFNCDLVKQLSQHGYEFTIVSTKRSTHPWLHEFASLTPDIFCLHQFLQYADYPRFLNYLIQSRQIDAILISNSELGYSLVPYLRACHPQLALLDYTHVEEEQWQNGGYPGMAVRLGRQLDLHVTSTNHLKNWMIARGADPEGIQVSHTNIDAEEWNPTRYDAIAIRKRMNIAPETPVILFVGRMVDQKRPLFFARIIKQLATSDQHFVCLAVGEGEELDNLKHFIHTHYLEKHIQLLGARPNDEVRELMAIADILLLPSKYEGLALALFECMAMETVPVTTSFGGHPELVTPECGFLISPDGPELESYVEALRQLLSNPQQRRAMARCARQRIIEHFDLQHMAEGMEAAIQHARQIASERPSAVEDLALARYTAHMAIEHMRLEELADMLWHQRMQVPAWHFSRQMRQAILPIGTQRYEVYKRFRQALRRLGRAQHELSRRLKARLTALHHPTPDAVPETAVERKAASIPEEAPTSAGTAR